MKIVELEIKEVRGLRHLQIQPDTKNLVIVGANGSGKSGIVDAIDFLLTGRIQRLMGKGTRDLSIRRHGVHIGSDPIDAVVRAVIEVPGHHGRIEISRCIAQPDTLQCSGDMTTMAALQPLLELASRGQHSLSRREILKFITSEAGQRAQEIQALLNLSDIEAYRQALKKVRNELKNRDDAQKREVEARKSGVAAAAQLSTYDPIELLHTINLNRQILKGEPLLALQLSGLKDRLPPPDSLTKATFNMAIIDADVERLATFISSQSIAGRETQVTQLRASIRAIVENPDRIKDADRLQLLELGQQLLDDGKACPLCDTEWTEGALASHLETKLSRAREMSGQIAEARSLAEPMLTDIRSVTALVTRMIDVADKATSVDCASQLQLWLSKLGALDTCLLDLLNVEQLGSAAWTDARALGEPTGCLIAVAHMCEQLRASVPKATPQQTAWDLLTQIEEHTKLFADADARSRETKRAFERGDVLYVRFEAERDAVLQELYDRIRDRFVELYREIHAADESSFQAAIRPDGAGLALEVDFFGTGNHPPHALHSEGHQDSMGLCLYLALAEHLNKGIIDLIVLDDVVMSVDSGHRRAICRVLAKHFEDHQFLITTHERAWAGQLRTDGVVRGANCVTLYNWTLEHGPRVDRVSGDAWSAIRTALEQENVQGAAAALRYGLESFFRQTCGALRAPVKYNLEERWDLGEYLSASIGQFRKYLDEAEKVAKAWNDVEKAEDIGELKSLFLQAVARSEAEKWIVNPTVHYNSWANFTHQDFSYVVDAMQELCDMFVCGTCLSPLEIQYVGFERRSLGCPCSKLTFSLVPPSKQGRPTATVDPSRLAPP